MAALVWEIVPLLLEFCRLTLCLFRPIFIPRLALAATFDEQDVLRLQHVVLELPCTCAALYSLYLSYLIPETAVFYRIPQW